MRDFWRMIENMEEKENNLILTESKKFALRIIKLYRYLAFEKHEYVLSKQAVRSGTSIGANIREAVQAQSRADFLSKMQIALKEASETEYWLELLYESAYLNRTEFEDIYADCNQLNRILISIVKSTKNQRL
jgi:four helix bundle protein